MKYIFILITFFLSTDIYARDYVCNIEKGKIVAKAEYIDTFFVDESCNHKDLAYKLTDSVMMDDNNGYLYEIKSYRFVNDEYEFMRDTTFCRLDIKCYSTQEAYDTGTTYTFINDNRWLRFNHGGFGYFTTYWEDNEDIMFRKVQVSDDTIALLFRGFRDGAGLPELSVFILKGGEVTLVYNKEVDVSEIRESGTKTTFVIQDNWFKDDEEVLIPHLVNMVFGDGTITIE